MQIEQYVMAYEAEQDRLRAMMPEGFTSLRPVLRINAEIRDGSTGYLELNVPAEREGNRGWLNIAAWKNVTFCKEGSTTTFFLPQLRISFTGVGIPGGCPAERDNCGCYFAAEDGWLLRKPEVISANKEFCDCCFQWLMEKGSGGVSRGKTLPAYPTDVKTVYPKADLTYENAAIIPCTQVLGTYVVCFER